MKRRTLVFFGLILMQAAVPTLQYDAVDFLKPTPSVSVGEVAGVATNSKGHLLVYTRTGSLNVTVGTARAFGHGPSRLLEYDQNGKLVNEFGEGLYALTYAQSVRVDRQDNIWIVDQYSNMVVKFDPEGRVLLTFGRRPETASSVTANVGAGAARGGAAPAAGAAGGRGGAAAPRRARNSWVIVISPGAAAALMRTLIEAYAKPSSKK